jgi:polyisoprenoid-binding protein YceI
MGVSNVRGDFGSFSGAVTIDAGTIKDASATIQVQSINTGMAKRDEHLRAPDFFDVAKYPEITFKTRSIEKSGEQTILIGDFTMRGVTKELRLPVVLSGPVKDPWGNTRIGLQAHAMINRKDFGLTYSKVLETGGLLVAEEVSLNIEAEGIAEVPSAPAK